MSEHFDMALLGPLSKDINVEPDGTIAREVGGALRYSPVAAEKGGARTVAFVKSDLDPADLAALFPAYDGRLVAVAAPRTTSIENRYKDVTHEERDSRALCQTEPFKLADLGDIRADTYFLGGLLYGDFSSEFIAQLADLGKLAIDAQCLLRHADPETGRMTFTDWVDKEKLLPRIQYLKVDALEGLYLTGLDDRRAAAETLHRLGAREVVTSHHSEISVFDGDHYYRCPYQVSNYEGRTGRGDTVFAAYVARRRLASIADSLLFATALVSLKIERMGPFMGTIEDVKQRIADQQMVVHKE